MFIIAYSLINYSLPASSNSWTAGANIFYISYLANEHRSDVLLSLTSVKFSRIHDNEAQIILRCVKDGV